MRSLVPARAVATTNGSHVISPLRQLGRDADGVLGRLLDDPWRAGPGHAAAGAPLDVIDLDDRLLVTVELPGVDPAAIDVTLTGQVLTVAAEKRDDAADLAERRAYSERRFGALERSVKLPCPVEADSVKAEHRHGLLTVTLEKSGSARPKRIRVDGA